MDTITNYINSLLEYDMTPYHKAAIARAHRGNRQTSVTKKKISKSMEGKTNHKGKTHSKEARDRISAKRGQYDPIEGKRWIVSRSNKTYRRYKAPEGFKLGKRKYNEEFVSFKDFLLAEEAKLP